MKTKTKDRLLTAGCVLLICAGAVSTPGCSTVPRGEDDSLRYMCTTDSDCEMHERLETKHHEAPARWKLWTSIGLTVLVSGYLYAHHQDHGGDQRGGSLNASIQPVTCADSGCAK